MKRKAILSVMCLLGSAGLLASCGGNNPTTSASETSSTPATSDSQDSTTSAATPVTEMNISWETKKDVWYVGDTNKVVVSVNEGATPVLKFSSTNTEVATVDDDGLVTVVGKGTVSITVVEAVSMISKQLSFTATVNVVIATGGQAYDLTYDQKGEVLSILEKYAIDNGITGTSIFENGGYVMYNPRVVKGTTNYITGYGYGVLSDGSLTGPLKGEPVEKWKMYYHSYTSEDPQTINALDAQGSLVSDLYGYISAGLYGTKMNETKDGYIWFPQLAKGKPVAIDSKGEVVADPGQTKYNTWKIFVNTGKDGLKYNTNSTMDQFIGFNNRDVQLDDYLTAFRVLLTQKYGYYRSAENAAPTNSGFIKGADVYYRNTKEKSTDLDTFLKQVAIVPNYEENSLTFTLGNPCTQFYAQYYIGGYNPMPEDFFALFEDSPKALGSFVEKGELGGATPVDTSLSVGPYTLESWTSNATEIVFKKNPNYVERLYKETSNRYTIDGVHIKVLPGITTDPDLAVHEFIEEKLDSASLTKNTLSEYVNDPRTSIVKGTSVFKLNFNALDQETWIKLFGKEGTVYQHPSEQTYYECKPIMSNPHFIKGLGLAINRQEYAAKIGNTPSQEYFSGAYLIDPEQGIAYNDTKWHKDVMKDYYPETFGYNKQAAIAEFREAVEELVDEGLIKLGSKKQPNTQKIMITWMNANDPNDYHLDIKQYWESAFNDPSVCDGRLNLVVESEVAGSTYDVVYDRMKQGEFDVGFGAISGMSNDPLGFMEVLKSDNSSGFTLNWGTDTSEVSETIVYDNKYWSFDGLWEAACKGTILDENGKVVPVIKTDASKVTFTKNSDGSLTVDVLMTAIYAAGIELTFKGGTIYNDTDGAESQMKIDLVGQPLIEGNTAQYKLQGTFTLEELKDLKLIETVGSQEYGANSTIYISIYYELKIGDVNKETQFDFGPYKFNVNVYNRFANPEFDASQLLNIHA